MRKVLLFLCVLVSGFSVFGQLSNNAFNLNNDYGDLRMRRYVSGDLIWKRALVTGSTTLHINYGGDFSDGTRIMGSRLMIDGNVGIGTTNPTRLFEIRQKEDPNSDSGLLISEPNNSQKIALHLANNSSGEYGYLSLGGQTSLRGNGKPSYFEGFVGVGTTTSDGFKFAVNGSIRAKEIKVEADWADYVFKEDYNLPTLKQVEEHIAEKGHLINIPSAEEVAENGIQLGAMNAKLLEKIEELTLYTIVQEKKLNTQQKEIEVLKKQNTKINDLEQKLNQLINHK